MTHAFSKRLIAATVATLQVIPAVLVSTQAHAQQTNSTGYGYDAQGNLTTITDPNGQTTLQEIDNLNRVQKQTLPQPVTGAANPVVRYTYDGQNRLIQVIDPRNAKPAFTYFGLNDVAHNTKETGQTISWFNENGDNYYSTNIRGMSRWVSSYDQLNRPANINYVDENTLTIKGHTKLNYDAQSTTSGAENYGVGQLTSVIDYLSANNSVISNSISLRYDVLGRVTWRCQFVSGVSAGSATACDDGDALRYRWAPNSGTDAGRLQGLTYPSGRKVDFQYTQGRISAITTTDPASLGGTVSTVISSVAYTPLDMAVSGFAAKSWNFGNGSATPAQAYSRQIDTWGRVSGFSLGAGAPALSSGQAAYSLTLDDAGRIQQIDTHSASSALLSNVYAYDNLNRLKSATLPGGTLYSYDYDASGNRTLSVSGGISTTYAYPSSGTNISNRLSSVTVGSASSQGVVQDATGNVMQDPAALVGAVAYTYDDRANVPFGRLSRSQGPGAQWDYLHNFFGQRIRKTGSSYTPSGGSAITPNAYVGSTDTLFYYDMAGHLIAEVDATAGASVSPKPVKREYIWLGDTLVAIIAGATPTAAIGSSNAPTIYYVHSDHLNTPRMVTDAAGAVRWSWDLMTAEPYGVSTPNEAPAGQASAQQFTLNMRFPGQYLDKETGSFYNYFRTYNPSTGRYLQSDPIGLDGGLNTYSYVGGNPLSYTDSQGLFLDTTGIYTTATAASSATGTSVAVAGAAVTGAVAVGVGIGVGINKAVESLTGDSIGGHIYDWLHPQASSNPSEKARVARRIAEKVISRAQESSKTCPPDADDSNNKKCEKQLELDDARCLAIASSNYGYRGLKICESSAMERYSQCLQGRPITTPLAGVDTPL